MKKTPYRVIVEFSATCDVLRAACTCPAGLGVQGKGKCNLVGRVFFAVEDFTRRELQKNPEPLTYTSQLSVCCVTTFRIVCLQLLSFFFMTLNQNAQAVMNNQLQPRKKGRGIKRTHPSLTTMTLLQLILKTL